ncbi:MAG TPA: hypothetical protein PLU81_12060 [Deltaproteobacteria bacterium]|nr:hypothetical protein [Deltaproteobacteria bacterium]
MPRKNIARDKSTVEWERKFDNIGVIWIYPPEIIERYLQNRNLIEIINHFWDENISEIPFINFCILSGLWWQNHQIIAARVTVHTHPQHHVSQYVFDKEKERLIIDLRQPDLDGKHWEERHIHLKRGQKDPNEKCKVIKPFFNKHIKLIRDTVI